MCGLNDSAVTLNDNKLAPQALSPVMGQKPNQSSTAAGPVGIGSGKSGIAPGAAGGAIGGAVEGATQNLAKDMTTKAAPATAPASTAANPIVSAASPSAAPGIAGGKITPEMISNMAHNNPEAIIAYLRQMYPLGAK